MIKASAGQFSDIPAIRKSLANLLSVARQDVLMGHEEAAQQAQVQTVRILTTYTQKFSETCQNQSFPIEFALGLERQNLLLGTGITVENCMTRKFTADLSSQGINYHFESCSNLLNSLVWDIRISGRVVGAGKARNRRWVADVSYQGYKQHPTGDIDLVRESIGEEEEIQRTPNDAGPNAKPNGRASAPVPKPAQPPRRIPKDKIRMTTIVLTGDRGFQGFTAHLGSWAETEIRMDDKPCAPVTQADIE